MATCSSDSAPQWQDPALRPPSTHPADPTPPRTAARPAPTTARGVTPWDDARACDFDSPAAATASLDNGTVVPESLCTDTPSAARGGSTLGTTDAATHAQSTRAQQRPASPVAGVMVTPCETRHRTAPDAAAAAPPQPCASAAGPQNSGQRPADQTPCSEGSAAASQSRPFTPSYRHPRNAAPPGGLVLPAAGCPHQLSANSASEHAGPIAQFFRQEEAFRCADARNAAALARMRRRALAGVPHDAVLRVGGQTCYPTAANLAYCQLAKRLLDAGDAAAPGSLKRRCPDASTSAALCQGASGPSTAPPAAYSLPAAELCVLPAPHPTSTTHGTGPAPPPNEAVLPRCDALSEPGASSTAHPPQASLQVGASVAPGALASEAPARSSSGVSPHQPPGNCAPPQHVGAFSDGAPPQLPAAPAHAATDPTGSCAPPRAAIPTAAAAAPPKPTEQELQQLPYDARARCFCQEKRGDGPGAVKRLYTVGSFPAVWRHMARLPAPERHLYEIIRADEPCHLYYDLEFERNLNPGADGDAMVDALLGITADVVKSFWGIDADASHVVELDSSTDAKWSRHVLLRLPGAALAGAAEAKVLVTQCVLTHPDSVRLLAWKRCAHDERCQASFVDCAVYSKNRCFRTLWSCKFGKAQAFAYSRRYRVPADCSTPERQWRYALASDVTPGTRLLTCPTSQATLLSWLATPPAAPAQPPRLALPQAKAAAVGAPGRVDVPPAAVPASVRIDWKKGAAWSRDVQDLVVQTMPFVAFTARELSGGLEVEVYKIVVLGVHGHVAFDTRGPGAHFCKWVGRCHRHNFAYFFVDYFFGTITQKCWHPTCNSMFGANYWRPALDLPDRFKRPDLFQPPPEHDELLEMQVFADGSPAGGARGS